MARIRKVTLYNTLFISIAVKILSSKLQQLIHGTASPSFSYRMRPAQLSKRLYLLVLLHIFCVNKSSSHSICNFLGYNTKRQAAIPLGTHIITCCFSCISYASTSINARQWYQATPVSKKVGHDSRVGFSTFFAAVCWASLIVTDNFFVTFTSRSMLSNVKKKHHNLHTFLSQGFSPRLLLSYFK